MKDLKEKIKKIISLKKNLEKDLLIVKKNKKEIQKDRRFLPE